MNQTNKTTESETKMGGMTEAEMVAAEDERHEEAQAAWDRLSGVANLSDKREAFAKFVQFQNGNGRWAKVAVYIYEKPSGAVFVQWQSGPAAHGWEQI